MRYLFIELKRSMKNKKTIITLVSLVFGMWLLLSLGRLIVYAYKTAEDIRIWLPLTSEEKKQELYGNKNTIVEKIEGKIPKEKNILLLTDDGWDFFLLRYLLYPRRVVWIQDQTFSGEIASYDYVVKVTSDNDDPIIIKNKEK